MNRLLLSVALPVALLAGDDPAAFAIRQLEQHAAPVAFASEERRAVEVQTESRPINSHLPPAALDALKASGIPARHSVQPSSSETFTPQTAVAVSTPDAASLDYGFILWCALQWWFWLSLLRFSACLFLRRLALLSPDVWWFWTFCWPWRPLYRALLPVFRFLRERRWGLQATAKFTPIMELLSLLYRSGAVFFGRARWRGFPLFQPVGWFIERHIVLIGATAAGKTRWLITLLALCRGNVFVIDCAAQMINAVGRRLGAGARGIIGQGKDVRSLDPYGLARHFATSCWNVFRQIDQFVKLHGPDSVVGFVQKVAEALIKPEPNPANAWVTNDARSFIAGLILYVREKYPPALQNLVTLRRLLSCGLDAAEAPKKPGRKPANAPDGFRLLLDDMKSMGGAIASAAAAMEGSHSDTGKNPPRSAALEQTRWLDLPEMQRIVGGESDFDLHELKTGKLCLFVCAPVSDIQGTLSGFFRLLTVLTMEIFRRLDKVWLKHPMTLIADELPSLGHCEAIQDIGPEGRKHSIRLIAVAQDLEGIQRCYPLSWQGFLSNADARVFMSTVDKATIGYIAQALGTATRKEKVDAGWFASLFSRIMIRGQKVERPLLYNSQIEDVLHPDARNVIVLRYGRPMIIKNAIYYTELPVYFFENDRQRYGEKPGRRMGRWISERLIAGPQKDAQAKI